MKSIPLTRARHVSNFVVSLQDKGVPLEPLLNRSNLSVDLLETIGDDGVISALSMLDFAENAALNTGILDLGIWAGSAPLEGYGDFGRHVASAPNLHEAIMTFCREVRGECSAADYYLTYDGSRAWFCHGPVGTTTLQQSQHELYALMIIIQVIRLALGSNWRSSRIRLQSTDESGARENDFLLNIDTEFGAPITAVEFPIESLAAPLKCPHVTNSNNKLANPGMLTTAFTGDPLIALKELIALYTRQSKQPSIELAAELVGISTRSLQRYLSKNSISYSRLVDQVRFDMALPLLRDESITITEISIELGYADVAHFSRAFKRISGMPPRAYRQVLKH